MCDLAFRLGKTLSEIGQMGLAELAIMNAYYRKHDDQRPGGRMDRRFEMIAAVLAMCNDASTPKKEWLPKHFSWMLAEEEEKAAAHGGGGGGHTDEQLNRSLQSAATRRGSVWQENSARQEARKSRKKK